MNERYCSTRELAGLPGMPVRAGHVPRRMKQLGIEGQPKKGQGGGLEYPISALPPETRRALDARLAEAAAAGRLEGEMLKLKEAADERARQANREAGCKASLTLPAPAQARLDAKLHVLDAFKQFRAAAAGTIDAAREDFSRQYNRGEIAVEPWVRKRIRRVSRNSLYRWQRAAHQEGIAKLGGRYGNRSGTSMVESQAELRDLFVSMIVGNHRCSSVHLRRAALARFKGREDIQLPTPRALRRWVSAWRADNTRALLAVSNPDAWKSRYLSAFGSQSEDLEYVNQRWELDSTPGDVMLTDGRHVVVGVLDVFSRRMRLFVSKTSKATAIAALLRRALIEWGVPDQARTDGGADYVSNHVKRIFSSLAVDHQVCAAFQPWQKPHIERGFRTFSHGLVELLGGFIGHNVAERKAIEARASFADRLMKRGGELEVSMSSAQFQAFCDQWCDAVYLHEPNKSLGGKSPFEILSANRHPVRVIEDLRALDVLLAAAPEGNGRRKVQKKGIEVGGAWFIAPEVGRYIGDDVLVLLDATDLGTIYVYGADEGYLFTAYCPERTGVDRKEYAIKARAMQLKQTQEERAALKATARRVRTDEIVTEILAESAERAGKLARLPGPRTTHESPGLAEARRAVADRDEGKVLLIRHETPARSRRADASEDNPQENYRHWLRIDSRIAAGKQVSEAEREEHRFYQTTLEWQTMRGFFEDFPHLKQGCK